MILVRRNHAALPAAMKGYTGLYLTSTRELLHTA